MSNILTDSTLKGVMSTGGEKPWVPSRTVSAPISNLRLDNQISSLRSQMVMSMMRMSARRTTISNISGNTITLSIATTSALSGTSVSFTPGNTGGLIAIGIDACQACRSNNGSVVIGTQALQNDVGTGSGGEDQNAVVIGPSAGFGETGSNCAYGTIFEPVLIGNKVGGTGCGWVATQMIGNHINGFYGTQNTALIGGEIGVGTPGVVMQLESVLAIGDGEFNPARSGNGSIPVGTYQADRVLIYGGHSAQHAYNTNDIGVFGVGSFDDVGATSPITGTQDYIFGNNMVNKCSSCSYNIVVGGTSGTGITTGDAINTATNTVLVGVGSGSSLTSANGGTIVGGSAGRAAATAPITAFGFNSCANATGKGVLCVGYSSAAALTAGEFDAILGSSDNAGASGPSGSSSNDAILGSFAGNGETANGLSYVGYDAGSRNVPSLGTNTAVGYEEFLAVSGATGTERYDAFFGDTSNCNGCTFGISLGHAANIGAVAHSVQIDGGTNSTANTMQFQDWNFLDSSGNINANLVVTSHGASAIASASTIAPSAYITHISGTAEIDTITSPTVQTNGGAYSGCIHLIPDGAFALGITGNIAIASTAVVGREMEVCYDGTKWYPSY